MRSRRLFRSPAFRSSCLPEERRRHPNRRMHRASKNTRPKSESLKSELPKNKRWPQRKPPLLILASAKRIFPIPKFRRSPDLNKRLHQTNRRRRPSSPYAQLSGRSTFRSKSPKENATLTSRRVVLQDYWFRRSGFTICRRLSKGVNPVISTRS